MLNAARFLYAIEIVSRQSVAYAKPKEGRQKRNTHLSRHSKEGHPRITKNRQIAESKKAKRGHAILWLLQMQIRRCQATGPQKHGKILGAHLITGGLKKSFKNGCPGLDFPDWISKKWVSMIGSMIGFPRGNLGVSDAASDVIRIDFYWEGQGLKRAILLLTGTDLLSPLIGVRASQCT